ncbi:hypothetical protein GJU40_11160 [Bacillus lacus]|uniref:Uncharacterized protein n=1 Tax=Metabacillus lacus TaxID=1983721 RepID=A0A7X2IZK7_9BACI|nr:hypothetical protein [Metabacillus lacus]MRX72707.1 hypothetical protein [Metabacillus lacus]
MLKLTEKIAEVLVLIAAAVIFFFYALLIYPFELESRRKYKTKIRREQLKLSASK